MAAPRRDATIIALVCIDTLALVEYAVIEVVVLPLPSTQDDWLVATLFVAPMAAAFLLWLLATTARIITDILTLLGHTRRWITKARNRRHRGGVTPSPITPSAAYSSSSAGWPCPGPSYTSPPGREGIPGHEPRRTRTAVPADHHRLSR